MQPGRDGQESRPRTRARGATLPAGVRVVQLKELRPAPAAVGGSRDAHLAAVASLRDSLRTAGAVVLSVDDWQAARLQELSETAREALSAAAAAADGAPPAPLPLCVRQLPGTLLLEYRYGEELPGLQHLESVAASRYVSLSRAGRAVLAALSDIRVRDGRMTVPEEHGTGSALSRLMEPEELEPNATGCSLLSLFRYSPGVGAPPHTDRGLLTLVIAEGDGLQLHTRAGGWQPLRCAHGQVAVLAGETLAHATRGAVAPSLHRVEAERQHGGAARTSVVMRVRGAPEAALPRGVGVYADATTVAAFESAFCATHGSINAARAPTTRVDLPDKAAGGRVAARRRMAAGAPAAAVANAGDSAADVVLRTPHLVDAIVALLEEDDTGAALARGELLCTSLRRAIAPRWRAMCAMRLRADEMPDVAAPDDGPEWRRLHRLLMQQINIRVTDQDNTEVHFTLSRYIRFRKLFDAYIKRKGLEEVYVRDGVRFLYGGMPIDPRSSPYRLELEDGDSIDAIMAQIGD